MCYLSHSCAVGHFLAVLDVRVDYNMVILIFFFGSSLKNTHVC